MGTLTGGQLVARMLKKEGVGTAFTLSGLHIAPIYAGCVDEGIRLVDTRHEQAAAHAADAWARLSRAGRLAGRKPDRVSSSRMAPAAPFRDDSRPRSAGGTHVRDLDGERIVYDPATHDVVVLNEAAAFILGLCDGTRSVTEMLAELERRYAAPRERLKGDLAATLADLAERRLVSE